MSYAGWRTAAREWESEAREWQSAQSMRSPGITSEEGQTMMQRLTRFLMGPLMRAHADDHSILREEIEALNARQYESAALVESLKARLELKMAQMERNRANPDT